MYNTELAAELSHCLTETKCCEARQGGLPRKKSKAGRLQRRQHHFICYAKEKSPLKKLNIFHKGNITLRKVYHKLHQSRKKSSHISVVGEWQ